MDMKEHQIGISKHVPEEEGQRDLLLRNGDQMNNCMKFIVFINLFGIVACSFLPSDRIPFPEGWRSPSISEYTEEWRHDSPSKYFLVNADFNGDGVLDEAKFLINDKLHRFVLVAFVSSRDGSLRAYVLEENNDLNRLGGIGITKVSPGYYKTICGKKVIDCKDEQAEEVFIKYDAISYFKYESANMFFYWDPLTSSFKKAYIDD